MGGKRILCPKAERWEEAIRIQGYSGSGGVVAGRDLEGDGSKTTYQGSSEKLKYRRHSSQREVQNFFKPRGVRGSPGVEGGKLEKNRSVGLGK